MVIPRWPAIAFGVLATAASVVALGLVRAGPAAGAHPGSNGKIAFYTNRDGNDEFYVMAPDGTGPTNITNSPTTSEGGGIEWSPDGRTVLFSSNRDGDYEIFKMPADGSAPPKQLTFNTVFDGSASFSPDGSAIAFARGQGVTSEIFTMRADGTLQAPLTQNTVLDSDPSWSPAGDRIIFVSGQTGNNEIFSSDLFGNPPTNLTNNPAFDADPDWSPDGKQIAFASDRDGDFEIVKMNANGTGQAPLTVNAAWDSFPAWSPDGTRIAFQSNRAGAPGPFDIATMNADGTSQTLITMTASDEEGAAWQPIPPTPGPGGPTEPTHPPVKLPTLLTGRLAFNFAFNTSGLVTLNRLSVFDMKRQSNVLVRCLKGCSLSKRKIVPGAGWNLRPLFLRKRITIPASIEARITKPGLVIGRYLRLDITKRNRRVRSQVTECRIAYPSRKITNCRRI